MRHGPPPEVIAAGGFTFRSTVDIIRRGRTIAAGVPVLAGRAVAEDGQEVPERATPTLPLDHEGTVLDPDRGGILRTRDRIAVTTHIRTSTDRWDVLLGTYQVRAWRASRDGLAVTAHGPLRIVKQHLTGAPGAVHEQTPMTGLVMRLLAEDDLEAVFGKGLTLRTVPAGYTWGQDRLKTLTELCEVWPAVMRATPDGRIRFDPPPSDATDKPAREWRDGVGGTLISAPTEATLDGFYNHVLIPVRTTPAEGEDAEGDVIVEDHIKLGPLSVAYGWESVQPAAADAVTSVAQAQAVIAHMLARAGRRSQSVQATVIPDHSIDVGDLVSVRLRDGMARWGRVTGYDLPLVQESSVTASFNVGLNL